MKTGCVDPGGGAAPVNPSTNSPTLNPRHPLPSACLHCHIVHAVNTDSVERGGSVVECRTRNRESPGSNPL